LHAERAEAVVSLNRDRITTAIADIEPVDPALSPLL
jgi:hypothetical protein